MYDSYLGTAMNQGEVINYVNNCDINKVSDVPLFTPLRCIAHLNNPLTDRDSDTQQSDRKADA